MAYIGNARTLLILGQNVRDDLIPDGQTNSFYLSQEVPGGYEGNITVLRRRYVVSSIVQNTTAISIINSGAGSTLAVTNDQDLAAALSVITKPFTQKDISNVIINITGQQERIVAVKDIRYNGTSIEIDLEEAVSTSVGASASVSWGRTLDWEILEPQHDYLVQGTGQYSNRVLLLLNYTPSINDLLYVIHKGEATYNLVPSDKTVGPEQLQDNLRDFTCDRFLGTGNVATEFTLSKLIATEKSILVTVDGVVQEGVHENSSDQVPGGHDFVLLDGNTKIKFVSNSVPSLNAQIRVLHLGFSTTMKRHAFSVGQTGQFPPGSIGERELKDGCVTTPKLADGAVTTIKISDNAVDGNKLLIRKNQALRAEKQNLDVLELLKLDASDNALLKDLKITANSFEPITTATIDLGSTSKKYKDLFMTGNIAIDGLVDGVDVSELKKQVDELKANGSVPVGTIMIWPNNTTLPSEDWARCDGGGVLYDLTVASHVVAYNDLYAILGYTFGGGPVPNQPNRVTIRLPDLRHRVPVGFDQSLDTQFGSTEGLSANQRSLSHSHLAGDHTHTMAHTHTVYGHSHSKGSLEISTYSGLHSTIITFPETAITTSLSGAHRHTVKGIVDGAIKTTDETAMDFRHTHPTTCSSNGSHIHGLFQLGLKNTGDIYANMTNTSSGNAIPLVKNGAAIQVTEPPKYLPGNPAYDVDSSGKHTHTVSVSLQDDANSLKHRHTVDFKTGSSTFSSAAGSDEASHQHSFTISKITNLTDTTGQNPHSSLHKHENSTFSGKVGLATSLYDGDTDVTTSSPNTNITGPATGNTGSYTQPHMLVNFIIKFKKTPW